MRHLVRPAALVANFFDTLAPGQGATAQAIQQAVLDALPGVEASVKWGNLMFTHRQNHLLALVLHKGHAHLQVFQGAALVERFPQLEGSGRGMRILKFRYGQPVDADLVHAIVRAAAQQPSAVLAVAGAR
jgi:hypothetical protein